MLCRHFVAALVGTWLLVGGCSGGTPPATPTTAVTTSATTSAETGTPAPAGTETPSETPDASATATPDGTGTPDLSATGTPGAEETLDPAYVKLKEEGLNLALGKGYEEAIPHLNKALEVKPDDPEVHFYLMLSHGNVEDSPSPKSEAYPHAKKVLELAPGSSMAERARDYVLSAESEPKKPMPDLNADPIERPGAWKVDSSVVYTLPTAVNLLPDRKWGDSTMKELWYLEVVPRSVAEKIEIPKGTKVTLLDGKDYHFSKLSWRGAKLKDEDFDTDTFLLTVFEIEVDDGPKKGTKGWMVNQMDRFAGLTEKNVRVWGTKVGPRLPIAR